MRALVLLSRGKKRSVLNRGAIFFKKPHLFFRGTFYFIFFSAKVIILKGFQKLLHNGFFLKAEIQTLRKPSSRGGSADVHALTREEHAGLRLLRPHASRLGTPQLCPQNAPGAAGEGSGFQQRLWPLRVYILFPKAHSTGQETPLGKPK